MKLNIKTNNTITCINVLSILLFVLLLSGCQGMAFSPADAAVSTVLERPFPEFTVDANSVQVLQQVDLKNASFVMVTYTGIRASTGREQCIFTYQFERSGIGTWQGGSGGGGCSSLQPDPAAEAISVMAGISTNDKTSYSEVDGQVFRDDITAIRVTWKDGSSQTEDVVNSSYLIVREGQFENQKVEALNADGEVVYSSDPMVVPGKQ